MPLKNLIGQFLEHVDVEKNRSIKTIKNYSFYLDRFQAFAKHKGVTDPKAINLETMKSFRAWLNALNAKTPLKKNTQNYHLIAVRAFLKFLAKRDIKTLAAKKVELLRSKKKPIGFLQPDELERVLAMPAESHATDAVKKRDRALLELLFSTGLRVSEIASLKRASVNFSKDALTVRGKGNKYRLVQFSERAKTALRDYLALRKDVFSPLFIRHDRAFTAKKVLGDDSFLCLTPRSIQRIVQGYARMAGIDKTITPHTLRHTYATDLLKEGVDIQSVQSLLGHASATTTQLYTQSINPQSHKKVGRKRKKKIDNAD